MELRKYHCEFCGHEFWVDCDADEYPETCPYCQSENISITSTTVNVDDSVGEMIEIPMKIDENQWEFKQIKLK